MEGVPRAVIDTAQRLCCRGDECAVNTFWQFTINSPTQRPRETARGKAAITFFGCWKLRISYTTWMFEVGSRRRDRIAGLELLRKRHDQHYTAWSSP